jgi:hypothetical protein
MMFVAYESTMYVRMDGETIPNLLHAIVFCCGALASARLLSINYNERMSYIAPDV